MSVQNRANHKVEKLKEINESLVHQVSELKEQNTKMVSSSYLISVMIYLNNYYIDTNLYVIFQQHQENARLRSLLKDHSIEF